jgi:hypothetical protein
MVGLKADTTGKKATAENAGLAEKWPWLCALRALCGCFPTCSVVAGFLTAVASAKAVSRTVISERRS